MVEQIGHRIVGTIKSIQGTCSAGHKVGDKFELGMLDMGGLCPIFAHDLFPWMLMMELGGEYPWSENKDVLEWDCPDHINCVKIELRRIR